MGLRWEFYPPATPQFPGGFSNYNPVNNTLVIAGVGGNPSNLGMKTHYDYFAPRAGRVLTALTKKTVMRAGFGISYTPFEDNSYAYNTPDHRLQHLFTRLEPVMVRRCIRVRYRPLSNWEFPRPFRPRFPQTASSRAPTRRLTTRSV